MGLAGMGAGAAASLEDIVAQRILQQKLEQEIADRQQRFSLDQQRFNETAQNNAFDRKRTERLDTEAATARTAKADQEATARRGRSNMAGVIGMGLDPATAKREIAVSALNANTSVPDGVMEAMTPPKVERDPIQDYEERKKLDRKYDRPAVLKPERDPIADYEAKKKIDQQYGVNANGANPQKAAETRSMILEAAKGLKTDPGLGNFVGNRVLNPDYNMGISDTPRSGTSAANAETKFNTLKALLTLPNLGMLKGAMSDKDLAFIQAAGSSLNPKMDDPVFVKELDNIIAKFENVAGGGGGAAPGAPPPSVTLMFNPATGKLEPVKQ